MSYRIFRNPVSFRALVSHLKQHAIKFRLQLVPNHDFSATISQSEFLKLNLRMNRINIRDKKVYSENYQILKILIQTLLE